MYFITFLRNGILTNLREDVYKNNCKYAHIFFYKKKKGDVISRITADVLEIQHSFLSILRINCKRAINNLSLQLQPCF